MSSQSVADAHGIQPNAMGFKPNPDAETIRLYSLRNDTAVMRMTMWFAMGGAAADLIGGMLASIFPHAGGFRMLWGLWIPLCFLVIPAIHYLCRHIQRLEQRLKQLEARLVCPQPSESVQS
jgi:hypothetical protein